MTLARRIGVEYLSRLDVLDVGCGVRFTRTIINRGLPIASYTGVDVSSEVVDWLKCHVEGKAGWRLISHEDPTFFIADSFLCRPAHMI